MPKLLPGSIIVSALFFRVCLISIMIACSRLRRSPFFCAAKPREHPAERANTLRIRHALTKVGTIGGGATLPHYRFLECINSVHKKYAICQGIEQVDLSLLLTAARTRRAINPPRKN